MAVVKGHAASTVYVNAATRNSLATRNIQANEDDGAARDVGDATHILSIEDRATRVLGADGDGIRMSVADVEHVATNNKTARVRAVGQHELIATTRRVQRRLQCTGAGLHDDHREAASNAR